MGKRQQKRIEVVIVDIHKPEVQAAATRLANALAAAVILAEIAKERHGANPH